LLFPDVVVYPRYYITSEDRTKLMHVGSLCLLNTEEICELILPREGKFVFRVAGYERIEGETSWSFCGVNGLLNEDLQFEMRNGKCVAGAKLSATQYCHTLSSLAVLDGSLVLHGTSQGSLTEVDTVMLEHVILNGVKVPASGVIVESTSFRDGDLHVHFSISANLESSHFDGTCGDEIEAFTDLVVTTLSNAGSQGFLMTLLNQELVTNALTKDVLRSTSSIELEYLKLLSITYTDRVTSKQIETVYVDAEVQSTEMPNQKFNGSMVYGLLAVISMVVLAGLFIAARRFRSDYRNGHLPLPDSSTHPIEKFAVFNVLGEPEAEQTKIIRRK